MDTNRELVIITFQSTSASLSDSQKVSLSQSGVLWVGTAVTGVVRLWLAVFCSFRGRVLSLDCMGWQPRCIINNFLLINNFWMSSLQWSHVANVNAAAVNVFSRSFFLSLVCWRETETVYYILRNNGTAEDTFR